jgi:membrane protease YdiL (CAAX protease family)
MNIKNSQKAGLFALLVLIGLLYIINYPLSIWIASSFPEIESREYFSFGYWTIYTFIAYFVVAVCLYVEQDNLEEFHFDKLSLTIFALSGILIFFEWYELLSLEKFFHVWILLPSSLFIFFILIRKWAYLPNPNWRWVGGSIVVVSLVLIPATFIDYWYRHDIVDLSLQGTLENLIARFGTIFMASMIHIVPLEEVLFRGLLWGYLRRLHWKESKIFVIQAILFWFIHPQNMVYPLAFFISLPIGILAISFLTQRSRQLFPAMVFHILYNSFVSLIWQFLVVLQLL